MFCAFLEHEGFACMSAADGREAIKRIKERRPALILMDVTMPVMDGWEATRRIKGNPLTRDIPLLMLTAHAFEEHRLLATEVGADGFIAKPVLLDDLACTVRQILNLPQRPPGCTEVTAYSPLPVIVS